MAISEDQRALIQLLLEGSQSYADIASLLGITEADARARAQATLRELGGADPDADVALTDYLLGQADPIGRADVVRHLQRDPEALALATSLETKLRLLAPGAQLPRLPSAKGRPRAVKAPGDVEAAAAPGRPLGGSLKPRQRLGILIAGGLALAAIAVVVIVVGGDDDEPTAGSLERTADGSDGATGEETDDPADVEAELAALAEEAGPPAACPESPRVPAEAEELPVQLEPNEGVSASGIANFGLAEQTAFVDISLKDLDPTPKNRSYVMWLLVSPQIGYPLAPLLEEDSDAEESFKGGDFADRFVIPSPVLSVLGLPSCIAISLAENGKLARSVVEALDAQRVVLPYQGETILSGALPTAAGQSGNGDSGEDAG